MSLQSSRFKRLKTIAAGAIPVEAFGVEPRDARDQRLQSNGLKRSRAASAITVVKFVKDLTGIPKAFATIVGGGAAAGILGAGATAVGVTLSPGVITIVGAGAGAVIAKKAIKDLVSDWKKNNLEREKRAERDALTSRGVDPLLKSDYERLKQETFAMGLQYRLQKGGSSAAEAERLLQEYGAREGLGAKKSLNKMLSTVGLRDALQALLSGITDLSARLRVHATEIGDQADAFANKLGASTTGGDVARKISTALEGVQTATSELDRSHSKLTDYITDLNR